MVRFVNLTPHPITVVREECPSRVQSADDVKQFLVAEIPPSGAVARVSTTREKIGEVDGIPVYRTRFGEVTGLPDPQPDTVYIVSILVLQALGGSRGDVVAPDTSPAGAIRDAQGRIVAVRGFQII